MAPRQSLSERSHVCLARVAQEVPHQLPSHPQRGIQSIRHRATQKKQQI